MVGETPALRGWVLPGCLSALCFCWAVLFLGGLPALASAEGPPPPCPGPVLEIPEEMPQPDREVRGLRNDARESCATLDARLAEVVEVLVQLDGRVEELRGIAGNMQTIQQEQAEFDNDSAEQLHLVAERLTSTLIVEPAGGIEVSNPTNVAGVEDAVLQNSETSNSNIWAIFGMVVGFGLLAALYKLVRP